jgi:hypothetical protein
MQRAITVSLKEKGFALGFVYPTDASSGVFLRAGFKSIGSASYWVKILRSEHIISKYIKVELLSKVLAVTVDKVLSVIDLRHRLGNPDKFITETIERCDRRFDILWEAEKLKYYIVPSHSASYLNWKFSDCKTTQYKYYCLFDEEKNSLKAFIIYALKNEEAIIKDIFPAHSAFLPYLLVKFSDTMRRNNIRSIRMAYLGNDLFKKVIRKSGFWETLTKRKNLLYSDENCATALKDGWLNKNNYYFFFG